MASPLIIPLSSPSSVRYYRNKCWYQDCMEYINIKLVNLEVLLAPATSLSFILLHRKKNVLTFHKCEPAKNKQTRMSVNIF